MKLIVSTIFSLALLGHCFGDDSDVEEYKKELMEVLKKFVDIIEEHGMNVTVVASDIETWSKGHAKEVKEFSVKMPSNNVQKTESKITDDKAQEWIKTVQDISTKTKIRGRSRTAHIEHGRTEKVDRTTSEDDKWIETKLYRSAIWVKNEEKGYPAENPSFESFYHAKIPLEDGKEENVEVMVGYVETEVVKKSDTMSEDEVKAIEDKMRTIFFKYDCPKVMGRVLREHMKKKFESEDWQVIIDSSEEFYMPAKKYALVRAASSLAFVYAM